MDTRDITLDLVNRFIAARHDDNAAAIAELLSDDAVYSPPASMEMGPYVGPAAIAAALTGGAHDRFIRSTIKRDVHTIVADSDIGVVVMRTSLITVTGEPNVNDYAWIIRCRDGRIHKLDQFLDTLNAARAMGRVP